MSNLSPQQRAWITRRANETSTELKWSIAGKKAWKTRKKNQFKFKDTNKEIKDDYRKKKALEYKNSGLTSGYILLLPSQTCEDIKVINKAIKNNKYLYIGAETNKNAIKAINKANLDNFVLFPCSISDIVENSSKDKFSHIDLDFCETFSKYHETLGTALKQDIVKVGGTIAMTFCIRDFNAAKVSKELVGKCKYNKYNKQRAVVKNTLIDYVKQSGGYKYKFIIKPETYRSSKSSAPMLFAMLKRIK